MAAAFQVRALPDIPYDLGEMYSGLIPIDLNDASRALFFVFQPTISAPTDEIVIWLNGGPGGLDGKLVIYFAHILQDAARSKDSCKKMGGSFGGLASTRLP
jgi:hypothetical protein